MKTKSSFTLHLVSIKIKTKYSKLILKYLLVNKRSARWFRWSLPAVTPATLHK